MNTKEVVVRIVKSSNQPAIHPAPAVPKRDRDPQFDKISGILTGSTIGLAAGTSIYLLFKITGCELGGLESTLIVGLPSLLGTVTSLAVF